MNHDMIHSFQSTPVRKMENAWRKIHTRLWRSRYAAGPVHIAIHRWTHMAPTGSASSGQAIPVPFADHQISACMRHRLSLVEFESIIAQSFQLSNTLQAQPHRLAVLQSLDPASSDADKDGIASQFMMMPSCCVDSSFSNRLKLYMEAREACNNRQQATLMLQVSATNLHQELLQANGLPSAELLPRGHVHEVVHCSVSVRLEFMVKKLEMSSRTAMQFSLVQFIKINLVTELSYLSCY